MDRTSLILQYAISSAIGSVGDSSVRCGIYYRGRDRHDQGVQKVMDYYKFTYEMRLLGRLYKSMIDLESEYERIIYEMSGVKGIRYDKEPSSHNPILAESIRSEYSEKLTEIETQIDKTQIAIKDYESDFNRLTDEFKPLVEQLFIKGKSFAEVGRNVGYSDNGLYNKVRRYIEKL